MPISQLIEFTPHCKVKENLAVWALGRWQYYNVDLIEPLPPSSQSIINNGAIAANAAIPASVGTELTTFAIDEHQLLQLRILPLDDIELVVWETQGQSKFTIRTLTARVSLMSALLDPSLATSEFNVLGRDRTAFIQAYNNRAYAIAQSRFLPFGYKYILVPIRNVHEEVDAGGIMRPFVYVYGDDPRSPGGPQVMTGKYPLITSWVPGEARAA